MRAHTATPILRWERRDSWGWLTVGSVALFVFGPLFAAAGTPRVDLMWPFHLVGVVGPTCGLTRGVVAIFRAEPDRAAAFNPASFAAVAVAASGVLRAVLACAGKGWATVARRPGRGTAALGGAALAALWAYQQAHAGFLLQHVR